MEQFFIPEKLHKSLLYLWKSEFITMWLLVPGHFAAHQFTETLLCTLRESVPGDWSIVISYKPYAVKIKLTLDQSCIERLDDRASRVVSDNNCVVVVLQWLSFFITTKSFFCYLPQRGFPVVDMVPRCQKISGKSLSWASSTSWTPFVIIVLTYFMQG